MSVPGWVWDPQEADFQANLVVLRGFVDREGHARVPARHVETIDGDDHKLGSWVTSRRAEYGKGKLSAERIDALEAVPGWVWSAR